MAVLVEAISIIVRLEAIASRYDGGRAAFVVNVPNRTPCCDNELAGVGFMNPDDCKAFVHWLGRKGIPFENGAGPDVVVADQLCGITPACAPEPFIHQSRADTARSLRHATERPPMRS
jgi:hypothetical protein